MVLPSDSIEVFLKQKGRKSYAVTIDPQTRMGDNDETGNDEVGSFASGDAMTLWEDSSDGSEHSTASTAPLSTSCTNSADSSRVPLNSLHSSEMKKLSRINKGGKNPTRHSKESQNANSSSHRHPHRQLHRRENMNVFIIHTKKRNHLEGYLSPPNRSRSSSPREASVMAVASASGTVSNIESNEKKQQGGLAPPPPTPLPPRPSEFVFDSNSGDDEQRQGSSSPQSHTDETFQYTSTPAFTSDFEFNHRTEPLMMNNDGAEMKALQGKDSKIGTTTSRMEFCGNDDDARDVWYDQEAEEDVQRTIDMLEESRNRLNEMNYIHNKNNNNHDVLDYRFQLEFEDDDDDVDEDFRGVVDDDDDRGVAHDNDVDGNDDDNEEVNITLTERVACQLLDMYDANKNDPTSKSATMFANKFLKIYLDDYPKYLYWPILDYLHSNTKLEKLMVIRKRRSDGALVRTLEDLDCFFYALNNLSRLCELHLCNLGPQDLPILASGLGGITTETLEQIHLHFETGTLDERLLNTLANANEPVPSAAGTPTSTSSSTMTTSMTKTTLPNLVSLEVKVPSSFSVGRLLQSKTLSVITVLTTTRNFQFESSHILELAKMLESNRTLCVLDMEPRMPTYSLRLLMHALRFNRTLDTFQFACGDSNVGDTDSTVMEILNTLKVNHQLRVIWNHWYESFLVSRHLQQLVLEALEVNPNIQQFHVFAEDPNYWYQKSQVLGDH